MPTGRVGSGVTLVALRSVVSRFRRALAALIVLPVGLLIVACSQGGLPLPDPVFDGIRDADLSARGPQRIKNGERVTSPPGQKITEPQLYPGQEGPEAANGSPRRNGGPRPLGQAQAQKVRDGYEINFNQARIADVVKVVLQDTLQEAYIIDARVQGMVTLSTARPVQRNELISLLEAVLQMNAAALVRDGDRYKIIPVGEAVAGGGGLVHLAWTGDNVPPGFGVTVLPLRHVAAKSMLQTLEGFLTRQGSLRADVYNNLLLVRGTGRERESVMEVAATFDVDWLRGQSTGIVPLQHATPEEILPELQEVFQSGQGGAGEGIVRFQPIDRLNAILIITRRPQRLTEAVTWIKRLDKTNAAGMNLYVYQVENSKALDLAQVLNDTFGTGVQTRRKQSEVAPGRNIVKLDNRSGLRSNDGTISSSGTPIRPGLSGQRQPQTQTPAQPPQGPAPLTVTGQGVGGTGTPSSTSAKPNAEGEIRIIADEANNTLLIRANQRDYQKIINVLRRIDRPPLQVVVNATIAEVTLNNSLRYGVQVYLRSSDIGKGRDNGSLGNFNNPALLLKPAFPGLNFILGNEADPRFILDALSGLTEVKVVSSPSVVVLDNQAAVLQVGNEVPISTQQSQSTLDPNAPIINSIQFRDTGVILKVTPRVNSNGQVTMEIEQEISNVVSQTGQGQGTETLTPTISQRRIASTIAVYSGQTVLLGGLISDRRTRDKEGIPIIERVPIVGDLLGTTRKGTERTELIVFIRPEVIRDGEDASRITEELRSKLRAMAPPVIEHGWDARTRPGVKDPVPR